jgi:hypothetical protein
VRRPVHVALSLLCLAVSLPCAAAGCGAERQAPPDPDAALRSKLERRDFPAAGLSIALPGRIPIGPAMPPQVFRAGVGDWFMSAFAYPRSERLPRGRVALAAARRRLIAEVRERDPRWRLVSSRLTRADGAPAVELVGDQTLSRARVRTRSLHVYRGEGEYVLELAAGLSRFPSLDRSTFDPIARSLRVTGEIEN